MALEVPIYPAESQYYIGLVKHACVLIWTRIWH